MIWLNTCLSWKISYVLPVFHTQIGIASRNEGIVFTVVPNASLRCCSVWLRQSSEVRNAAKIYRMLVRGIFVWSEWTFHQEILNEQSVTVAARADHAKTEKLKRNDDLSWRDMFAFRVRIYHELSTSSQVFRERLRVVMRCRRALSGWFAGWVGTCIVVNNSGNHYRDPRNLTPKKLYLWFKHKSFGDIISLPMLKLSIIYAWINPTVHLIPECACYQYYVCLNQTYSRLGWSILYLIWACGNFGAYPRLLGLNQTCSFFGAL